MDFLFHCLKIQITGKSSKKPGDSYQSKMKDSRLNSLIHWFFRQQTQEQRGKLIKWQKRLSLGTGGCTVMFLQPSNRQIALIHWEAAIIEEEVKIMAKPALRPVGLWDPQAVFGYLSLLWHQEWDSEVWALFLKLSHLQDIPSTFRITSRAECERPTSSWAETKLQKPL